MTIYKFRDLTDGNCAFILAKSYEDALTYIEQRTMLDIELVDTGSLKDFGLPIELKNDILTF